MADLYKNDEQTVFDNLTKYNFGNEKIFQFYLNRIPSEEIKKIIENCRKWMKSQDFWGIIFAFNSLEKFVDAFFDGEKEVPGEDKKSKETFNMLGRQYETISKILEGTHSQKYKDIYEKCIDRAVHLFVFAEKIERAKKVFKKSPNYAKIEKLRAEIIKHDIEELGPDHYKI